MKKIAFLILLLFLSSSALAQEKVSDKFRNFFATDARKDEAVYVGEEIPDWLARWELARILSYIKNYDESIIEYRKVLKEKPDLTEARAELAQALFYSNREDEALKELAKISIEKIDDNTALLLAEVYAALKEDKKAEPLFRQYLKANPDDYKARLMLAEMYSWVKRYEESKAEYEKILKALPQDRQVRRKYALVLSWMGKHSEAAEELKKTLE